MARVLTGGLQGLHGFRVVVEVDLAPSLPSFSLVGLPSAALRESRERVGAALRHGAVGVHLSTSARQRLIHQPVPRLS